MSHQAIATKFLGPTNTRGARVRATCEARSVLVPWNYALGVSENHDAAARALITRLGWQGTWIQGCLRDVFVYVCAKRQVEGLELKTPHPQAVDPLMAVIVKREAA
jgi:hypothetical protein